MTNTTKDPICGMKVDKQTKFRLFHKDKMYYFCSDHCMNKFKEEHNITGAKCSSAVAQSAMARHGCKVQPSVPFYKNKTFIVAMILTMLVGASYVVPMLKPFRASFFMYIKIIWWAILLGLVLGGVIDRFVPSEYVAHLLARKGKRSIFNAVILGFFMSACSHGILALSIQLHKKGASGPAVVAFLLASPWANMTLTIMLLSLFGVKALFIIFSAIIIALITGFIFQFLEARGLVEKNTNTVVIDEKFSILDDVKRRFRARKFSLQSFKEDARGIYGGAISLSNMVLWWMLIGIGIASLVGAYIPTHFFQSYMGPTVLGLFVTLALATVIEVCSEGSAPMAFEIFRQTGALGNSFVFLMAGVATDYTEIGLLWHNVGKRTAIWLPVVTVPQVIALGYLANKIFS